MYFPVSPSVDDEVSVVVAHGGYGQRVLVEFLFNQSVLVIIVTATTIIPWVQLLLSLSTIAMLRVQEQYLVLEPIQL